MDLTLNDFDSIITVMHHSPELFARLDAAQRVVFKLHDNNLVKMWANCARLWNELDIEFVQCRRRQRLTAKYAEIAEKLDTALVVLEQHLTFGTLLKM